MKNINLSIIRYTKFYLSTYLQNNSNFSNLAHKWLWIRIYVRSCSLVDIKKKVSKNFTFAISQNCSSTQVVHTLLFHPTNPDQNCDRNSTDLSWIVHSECMYGQQCQIQHLTPFASQSVLFSEQIKRLVSKNFGKNIVLFNLMFVSVLWKSVFCLYICL